MSESHTEVGKYRFTVKESGDGTPWIAAEPYGGGVAVMNNAVIGFDLPKGVTIGNAHDIAAYMNRNLSSIKITLLI